MNILVLLVPVVSKSSFLLLSVVLLAAAGLQAGGARLGEIGFALRVELRADIASLKDDVHVIRTQAEWAPIAFKTFWDEARKGVITLETDAAVEARIAATRISALIKTT